MLHTALGSAITGFLEGPSVVEVILTADDWLWINQLSSGLADTGESLPPADRERTVRLVAHYVGAEVYAASPELPEKRLRPAATSSCRTGARHP